MDDNGRTVKELIETLSKYDENERVRCFVEMGSFRTSLYCEDGDFGFFRNESGELEFQDANTVVTRVIWYVVPVGLTILGMVVWLANLG